MIWDVKSMKKPLFRFEESHNEDVTALQLSGDVLISSSIDNLLNIFNLSGQAGALEEDMIDGSYSSTQPLIACGFVDPKVIWTQTSINTVELIRVEDATLFLNIAKFPHDISYVCTCEVISGTLHLSCGNLSGEVYIYTVRNLQQAFDFRDDEKPLIEADLKLVDMILTQEPYVVRGLKNLDPFHFACCTEGNKV